MNCAEVAKELREQCGVEAATFPKLSEDTCQNYKMVRHCIDEWGLDLCTTLCITCTHRKTCPYRCGVASAHKADVVIATTKRLETDDKLIRGRGFIAIHEQCDDALVQQYVVTEAELKDLADLLSHLATLVPVWYARDSQYGRRISEWLSVSG